MASCLVPTSSLVLVSHRRMLWMCQRTLQVHWGIKGVLEQIEKDFGPFTNFREKFTNAALTQFGSGWVWLVLKKREERRLEVHSYYLDYKLTPVSNVYEAETMVEGTLERFSFESDDEGNKNAKTASKPADDQNGDTAEITKGSGKAKAKVENVVGKKRGRPSKEKQQPPAKKARSSAPKKTKPKK